MIEEIRLIAENRHLIRKKNLTVLSTFLTVGVLLGSSLSAEKKGQIKASWGLTGASIIAMIYGRNHFGRLEKRKEEVEKRLIQIQKVRT